MGNGKCLAFDLGSDMIRAAVAEVDDRSEMVVESVKESKSHGMRNGVIVNLDEAQKSIANVIDDLKSEVEDLPKTAFIGMGGRDVEFTRASGSYALSDGRNAITKEDIEKSHESARSSIQLRHGRSILHTIVEEYIVNSTPMIRNPLNLPGNRIETKMMMITASDEMRESYSSALAACGIAVDKSKFCFSALCASQMLLSEDQKESGAIVIDMGNEGTNMVAYQKGRIVFAGEVPFGSASVSQDLQYILQKPRETADSIKEDCSYAFLPLVSEDNLVEIPGSGTMETIRMPQSEISQIVSARCAEILVMLKEKLSGASKFLSFANGIFLIGGGALQKGFAELASDVFSLPARIAVPENIKGLPHECEDPRYVNVISLLKSNMSGLGSRASASGESAKMVGSDGAKGGKLKGFLKRLF